MYRFGCKALFRIVFSFILGLGLSVSASETVYPECKLAEDRVELIGDICSYDQKYDDLVYTVKNDEFEAIWYDDGQIMIWSYNYKTPGEYNPTLYIFNDGGTEFADKWTKDFDPINPILKNVFTHWPDLTSSFRDLSIAERRKIQGNLQRLDLLKNYPDGNWGTKTFTAVIAYNALFQKNIPVETYKEARQLLIKITRHENYNYNISSLSTSAQTSEELPLVKTPSTKKTTVLSKPDALEVGFLMQKGFDRRNIQMVLSDLGLYKSTIDGFYGSGTQRALKAYNKDYFRGLDLTRAVNVSALIKDILTPRVNEVEDPGPALDTLLNQIDDIVGGELDPSQVDESDMDSNAEADATQEAPQKSNLNAETAIQIQREMNRLGCNVGNADGVVGLMSREALKSFNKAQGTSFGFDVYFDTQFLGMLKTFDKEICKTGEKAQDNGVVDEQDYERFMSSLENSIWRGEMCDSKAEVRFSKPNKDEKHYGDLKFTPICLETEPECEEGLNRLYFTDGFVDDAQLHQKNENYYTLRWMYSSVGLYQIYVKIISQNRLEGVLRLNSCDLSLSRSN